ncbi:hypothetical protein F2Q70_00008320 [Brassica cretica]|uniref:Inhibitor I9 domain-containing protein n=1 Tax=Brassica cretica TaxID=69181 RepID=A0A8S9LVR4_BRACR|nr:hypothetical protein F2Q70_00008320 [Brassica cretica]
MEFSSLIVSNHRKHIALVFICLVLILKRAFVSSDNQESQIYTVHLGERQHDDPKLVTDSHHDILRSLLGSKKASRESMIYSYRHGFSGFAAKLTPSQARELSASGCCSCDEKQVYEAGNNKGYENKSISKLLGRIYTCPSPTPSMLDVNVPSITIPYLNEEIILTRTVTNVGPVGSVYKAVIEPPLGIKLQVSPETLEFGPNTKKITFTVKVSTTHRWNTDYYFGSLTWTDNGAHNVRIPLSVRTRPFTFKI